MRFGRARVQSGGLRVDFGGLLEAFCFVQDSAEVGMEGGALRMVRYRLADEVDGGFRASRLKVQQAQRVQRIGLVRLIGQ